MFIPNGRDKNNTICSRETMFMQDFCLYVVSKEEAICIGNDEFMAKTENTSEFKAESKYRSKESFLGKKKLFYLRIT